MSALSHCYNIEDLRRMAHKKIPRVMADYIEGGADDELTVAQNRDAFQDYQFLPKVLRDVSTIDLTTQVQGVSCSMPLLCAPTGMSRLFHYQGESAVAKAAQQAEIPYCLSTVSTVSIEQIARESKGPKFFQLYAWKDRQLVQELMNRCQKSDYAGILLAVDLATLGHRERDLRNGHGRKHELKRKTALSALTRPAWLYRFLTSPPMVMANMVDHLPDGGDAIKTANTVNDMFSPALDWDEARRLRDQWKGPFVLKGIQCLEDAKMAVQIGATGIVLSNHGGRQLDGAIPAMTLLPEVANTIGGQLEIIVDGGIRRGSDVIKALALGATACMIGRPYLYGLAAAGEPGVVHALEIFRSEMKRTMQLLGCPSLHELNGILRPRARH